jgi:hypothetical protein
VADIETSLKAYLCAQAGVTAIFGATASCRIYVDRKDEAADNTSPFAIIRTVAEAPDYAHDGALPDTGLYQIDVYSDSKTTANSGAAAIKTELSGLTGTMSAVTVGHCFVTDTRGEWDEESRTFKRSTDYEIGQNG